MRKYARPLFGALISAAAVYAIIRNVSISEVAHATAGAKPSFIVIGVVALALGYAIRSFRWWRMLRLGNGSISLNSTARVLMAGFAANNVLPLRAGDALRAFGFRATLGISSSFAVATLVLERLLDLFSLLLLALCFMKVGGLTSLPHNVVRLVQVLTLACLAAIIVALAFGAQIRRCLLWLLNTCFPKAERGSKLELAITNITSLFESLRPIEALHLTALSLAAWFLEALLYICAARALHLQVSFAWACMALVAGNFAAIFPSSPGYVGTFHASVLAILLFAGVERNLAAAYAVAIHGVLWCTVTLAGAIAYFSLRIKAVQTFLDSTGEVV